jgi:hypothetical protein
LLVHYDRLNRWSWLPSGGLPSTLQRLNQILEAPEEVISG